MDILWKNEDRLVSDFLLVPPWIDENIDCGTVAAIVQGGCSSGAYMDAVTYWTALQTMNEHGDDVLDFIEDIETINLLLSGENSWAGYACNLLSYAVEAWSAIVYDELTEKLEVENDDDAA